MKRQRKKIINGENKKTIEKAKSKNAVIVLVMIGIALLIVVGLVIIQQTNMQRVENDVQNNINSNSKDTVQNVQDNTEVDVYQEVEQNKDEQQVEQDNKEENATKKDNETTEAKQPEKEEQEQVKVDFDEIADKLFEAYGIKEDIDKLPQVTAEERPKYEKIWNDMVAEKNDEFVQIIKKKISINFRQASTRICNKAFGLYKGIWIKNSKE